MPALSDYVNGTISLTNGAVEFTGTSTGWLLAGFKEGDTIIDITGATEFMGVVATIDANGAGTLTKPWEGPTLIDVAYRMRYQPDGARVSAQARNLIELLGNGNVLALAGLSGSANQVPMFTGPGAMTLVPKTELVTGVAYDVQVDNLADRDAYDGQAEGFSVLVADVGDGRAAVYTKDSATSGDWTDPAYVTGPVGPIVTIEAGTVTTLDPGSAATAALNPVAGGYDLDLGIPAGEGFVFRGAYSGAADYVLGDVTQDAGSSWILTVATSTGNAPPTLPTTSNAYWQLLARQGTDGAGTVTTLTEGPGISIDLTDPTNPVIAATGRERLAADRAIFIRSDGNDSNDGLANTAGGAFLTLQGAWNKVANGLDLSGYTVSFFLGAGSFAGVRDAGKPLVGGKGIIRGAGSASTTIAMAGNDCIEISQSEVTIAHFKMTNSNGSAVHAYRGGVVTLGEDIDFGACSEAHHFCDNEGQIVCTDGYKISGAAPFHFLAHTGGFIAASGRTVTITGTPAFSSAFACATRGGILEAAEMTFTGSATGRRFLVDNGGVLWANNLSPTYFPGSTAGELMSGAYDDRSKIVGTVSQSAGLPTGAIIERGSNSNGSYVRFADGTQICWGTINYSNITTAAGAIFLAAAVTWTYPIAFVNATETVCQASDTGSTVVWVGCVASATTASLQAFSYASASGTRAFRAMAIGRWF
ncbi:hypothetical protein [Devosia lacusdianchii]|uniref:hypothetical protein n=1 Tax=Devosia lacusdianchii TaxID=2917991 RepID=UPI001F05A576|nr:hypothetical protein [Devosia sp. JXJ CY 41]